MFEFAIHKRIGERNYSVYLESYKKKIVYAHDKYQCTRAVKIGDKNLVDKYYV